MTKGTVFRCPLSFRGFDRAFEKRVIFLKKVFDGSVRGAYKAPPDDAGRSEKR